MTRDKVSRFVLLAFGLAAIALGIYTLLTLKNASSRFGSILVAVGAITGGISIALRSRGPNPPVNER